jgi:hypothetical protein
MGGIERSALASVISVLGGSALIGSLLGGLSDVLLTQRLDDDPSGFRIRNSAGVVRMAGGRRTTSSASTLNTVVTGCAL